jgi:hypothetical protein
MNWKNGFDREELSGSSKGCRQRCVAERAWEKAAVMD